jgi:hypothetical protein
MKKMPPGSESRGNRDAWRQRAAARPRRAAAEPVIHYKGPKPNGGVRARAVGSWMPGLTRKAFEKYGFSTAELIVGWTGIVGKDLAAACEPIRLKWPRAVGAYDDTSEADLGRPGATLLLAVDPARALEVEYQRRQIIERVNVFFGYKALSELKIIQTPRNTPPPGGEGSGVGGLPRQTEGRTPTAAGLPPPPPLPGEGGLAGIEDEGLRKALAGLAANIHRRNSS